MIIQATVALLFAFSQVTTAQVLECPFEPFYECMCDSLTNGPYITCIAVPMEEWDIKASFDYISGLFNDTEAVMDVIHIYTYYLQQQQEVPANAIETLKARRLRIEGYWQLTSIHPEAFPACHESARELYLYQVNFRGQEEQAFELINNFINLEIFHIYVDTTLTQIPAYAFSSDLQYLNFIRIAEAQLETIGDFAFAGLPMLKTVILANNSLTPDGISNNAFTFASQGVDLILEDNPGLTHLPAEKFEQFFSDGTNSLFVGPEEYTGYDPEFFLHCDERMNWFCSTDITRVYGYWCKEAEYSHIYDYCEKTFGSSPFDSVQNLEELKRIERNDRMRRETIRNQLAKEEISARRN